MTRFHKAAKKAQAAPASNKPIGTLNYFPIRGRAETIRLILAANELEWEEIVQFDKAAAGTGDMPFGQCPTWFQKSLGTQLSQMDAICRHIGRQVGWYGRGGVNEARIDEVLGGIEDLRMQYVKLIYVSNFDKQALQAYQADMLDLAGMNRPKAGAHLQFLENFLARHGGEWAVGDRLSIADAAVFDLFDLHVDLCNNSAQYISTKPLEAFPLLAAHRVKFSNLAGVKAYLTSSKRPTRVNNSDRF